MSQHISRVVYQGQRCLSSSNLSHAAKRWPISPVTFLASSSRRLSTATTKASTATTKATRSYTPISRVPTPPPTKTTDELASGPYIVRRTPSAQLPVYKQLKSGGNRVVVLIKKVDGDRRKLLEDMVESLGVSQGEIRINPTTQNLELKGDYYEKAKSWLLAHGF